jgi:hypothetical protein
MILVVWSWPSDDQDRHWSRHRILAVLAVAQWSIVFLEIAGLMGADRPSSRTTLLLLIIGGTVAVFGLVSGARAQSDSAVEGIAMHPGLAATVVALLLAALGTAFGSGMLPFVQARLASPLILAGAVVIGSSLAHPGRRLAALTLVAVAASGLGLAVASDIRTDPYRAAPIALQVVPTKVGPAGTVLFLEPERAEFLTQMAGAATEAGWVPGTRLFGLALEWSSTVPWHLSAQVPDSLMLTLGADAAAEAILEFNLSWVDLIGWDEAWVTVSAIDSPHRGRSLEFAARTVERVGKRFPEDYQLVWRSPQMTDPSLGIELWRPSER